MSAPFIAILSIFPIIGGGAAWLVGAAIVRDGPVRWRYFWAGAGLWLIGLISSGFLSAAYYQY